MRKYIVGLVMALAASPAFAQGGDDVSAACAAVPPTSGVSGACYAVAQALVSAQPQLGILLAGGNPELGTSSTGGVRLGILPKVNLTLRGNVVFSRLPDILLEGMEPVQDPSEGSMGFPVPALGGNVSVGLFDGVSLAPTLGGFGSLDLLGSATWIPAELFDVDGFEESPELAWGVGARVGLIRESFTMPGVALSLMYRRQGELRVGDACQGEIQQGDLCGEEGDPGEVAFDLTNWSARATVGKRILGLGLAAGVGFDRFESDGGFAFRGEQVGLAGTPQATRIRRFEDLELSDDRWSAFGNLSWGFLVGSLVLEAGWMQGGEAVQGFTSNSFDPGEGTFFGSVGIRLSL